MRRRERRGVSSRTRGFAARGMAAARPSSRCPEEHRSLGPRPSGRRRRPEWPALVFRSTSAGSRLRFGRPPKEWRSAVLRCVGSFPASCPNRSAPKGLEVSFVSYSSPGAAVREPATDSTLTEKPRKANCVQSLSRAPGLPRFWGRESLSFQPRNGGTPRDQRSPGSRPGSVPEPSTAPPGSSRQSVGGIVGALDA